MAEEENNDWDEEQLKEKETVLMEIGKKYRDDGNAKDLEIMIKMIRPFTKLLSKAKAAKLIRLLVDMYLDMETTASSARAETAVELCKECITWATEEKRIFLRQVSVGSLGLETSFTQCVPAGPGGEVDRSLSRRREVPGGSR